jgi:hypothetical protein
MKMIEIYHLIYYRSGGNKPQYARIIYRKNWDFTRKNEKDSRKTELWIPYTLQELLHEFYNKWFYVPSIRNNQRILEFTLGLDKKEHLFSIALKAPPDNFNKQIARDIVTGRIKRMKGEIEGREPYDLDEFYLVYKEE